MTREIIVETTAPLNTPVLVESLRDALGAALRGLQTEPGRVRVVLAEDVAAGQVDTVRAVLAAHDPNAESTLDAERRTRRARLIALRAADTPLDVADFAGQPELTRRLARKVLLLEARLEALSRGNPDDAL
jgi:hypothetical protein